MKTSLSQKQPRSQAQWVLGAVKYSSMGQRGL